MKGAVRRQLGDISEHGAEQRVFFYTYGDSYGYGDSNDHSYGYGNYNVNGHSDNRDAWINDDSDHRSDGYIKHSSGYGNYHSDGHTKRDGACAVCAGPTARLVAARRAQRRSLIL